MSLFQQLNKGFVRVVSVPLNLALLNKLGSNRRIVFRVNIEIILVYLFAHLLYLHQNSERTSSDDLSLRSVIVSKPRVKLASIKSI